MSGGKHKTTQRREPGAELALSVLGKLENKKIKGKTKTKDEGEHADLALWLLQENLNSPRTSFVLENIKCRADLTKKLKDFKNKISPPLCVLPKIRRADFCSRLHKVEG